MAVIEPLLLLALRPVALTFPRLARFAGRGSRMSSVCFVGLADLDGDLLPIDAIPCGAAKSICDDRCPRLPEGISAGLSDRTFGCLCSSRERSDCRIGSDILPSSSYNLLKLVSTASSCRRFSILRARLCVCDCVQKTSKFQKRHRGDWTSRSFLINHFARRGAAGRSRATFCLHSTVAKLNFTLLLPRTINFFYFSK